MSLHIIILLLSLYCGLDNSSKNLSYLLFNLIVTESSLQFIATPLSKLTFPSLKSLAPYTCKRHVISSSLHSLSNSLKKVTTSFPVTFDPSLQ